MEPTLVETDTVVIGASAAGLATAACLKRARVPFILLEEAREVAAVWRKHYERLHLHTTKGLSHLPGLSFPRGVSRYPARAQVVEYLDAYSREFGLTPCFGQRVVSVSRSPNGWVTRTVDTSYRSRNVVLATGNTRVPRRPVWPGQDTFNGWVVHSSEYRTGRPWAGKRILVVGFGNSGGEIAIDLCEQGAHATLSVRSPVNVIPRDFLGLSILAWGIALSVFPVWLADAIGSLVSRLTIGRLDRLGLRKLPYGPIAQIRRTGKIPLLDVGTIARIRGKEVDVVPGIESFTRSGARFTDGVERPFEGVVLATGFRAALNELLEVKDGVIDAEGTPLRSGLETLPGLFFCGFYVAPTGMLREIAREARNIAESIALNASGSKAV
jgi:indole-3-pyruvate monooxygenase